MSSNRSTLYKQNLKTLSRYHSHILDVMEAPAPFNLSVRTGSSGLPNLYVGDGKGGERCLYPDENPTAGLQPILEKMKSVRGRIVCHYGFGIGLHAVDIVRELASANIVVLFEAHPAVLGAAMDHVDLTGVFSHPNVRLVVGRPVDFFSFLSGDPEEIFASVKHVAIRFDADMALAPAWYEQVSNAMVAYNNYHVETQNTLATSGLSFLKNRFRNLMAMSRAVPMENIAGKLSGVPAILVAAGPSLSKNIDRLKGLENRALLIAVDSAVGPLAEKGISPDLVVSTDHRAFTYEKMAPFKDFLRNTGLVFTDLGAFNVPNYLPFKALFYTISGPMYHEFFNRILQTNISDPMTQSQSVIHPAMHFVRQAGCDPIIFTGLDLAFDQGRDHAEGTVLHWGNRWTTEKNVPMVPDIHGRMVPTHVGFLNMLATCEKKIAEAPERTWIDATEGGAKVAGTVVMTLDEAIGKFCPKPVDIRECFDLPPGVVSEARMSDALRAAKRDVEACMERLDTFLKYAVEIDDFLAKNNVPEKGAAGLPENIRRLLDRMGQITSIPEDMALRKILVDYVSGPRLDIIRGHRASVMSALASKDTAAIFIRSYEQLKASQKIWRDGFRQVLELLEFELEAFESIERAKKETAGTEQADMALAAAYFKYDYLKLAMQHLDGISSRGALIDFYSGAVRLKQGDVVAGMELMRSAVRQDAGLGEKMERIVREVEDEWLSTEGLQSFKAILRKRLIAMGPSKNVQDKLWPENLAHVSRIISGAAPSPEEVAEADTVLSEWAPVMDKLPEWLITKANLLSVQGRPEEGLDVVETALSMCRNKNPQWLALSARLLIEAGRADEGISKLDEAVALDPQTAVLWEEIGDALAAGRDYDGALAAYEKCLSALPGRLDSMKKIGDCYAAAGHPEAARMAYDQVQTLQGSPGVPKDGNG
jgi:hypothetical protein